MKEGDWTLGLSASALSGLSSAYAGVYFEKYVKGKMSSTLWIRNLQLGIYGLPLSIAYMYAKDHANLANGGIMQVAELCCAVLCCAVLCCAALRLSHTKLPSPLVMCGHTAWSSCAGTLCKRAFVSGGLAVATCL